MADLSLLDQFFQHLGRLLGRGVQIGPVDLVEVDVVGFEVVQAGLDSLAQPLPAGVADQAVAVHAQPALGSDDHVFAAGPFSQRVAQGLFGYAEPVALCRVEEVDPQLHGVMDGVPAVLESAAPQLPPKAQVPNAIAETWRSVRPSRTCRMLFSLLLVWSDRGLPKWSGRNFHAVTVPRRRSDVVVVSTNPGCSFPGIRGYRLPGWTEHLEMTSAAQGSPGLLPRRCETRSLAAKIAVAQVARTAIGGACWQVGK